ncbi:hypothetical protein RIF29_24660 [Crotalaria pallida]|uniref:Uncharacterized protein n=1 Tax=Crotalaria pallida TaxID=3830 RepID=A0AAN9EQB5_CROPI
MVTPVSDHDSVLELVGAIKDNLPMLLREVGTLDRLSTQGFTFKPTWKSSSHYAGSTVKYASKAAKRTGKGAMAKACLLTYELTSWRGLVVFVHALGEEWSQGDLWAPRVRYALIMLDHWILRARLLSIPYGLKQIATSWLDLGLSTTPIMVQAKQRIHVPRRGEFGNITSRKEKVPALIGGLQKKLWRLTPNLRRLDVAGTYKLFPSTTGSVPEDRQGFSCFLSLRREKGGDPRIKRVKEPFLFADRLGALA